MSRWKLVAGWIVLAGISLVVGPSDWASAQSGPLAEIEQRQQELFSKVAPSVVFITHGNVLGSGFFISSDGTILTNAHVVGESETVDVVLHDGRRATGEVLKRKKSLDLALVGTDLEEVEAIELAGMKDLKVGSWVASIGHGSGVWSFTTGAVSNIYPDGEERPVFQTQIPINRGSSGGPVIDRRGRAVGVVTLKMEDAENLNFAVPIQIAMKRFGAMATHCDCLIVEAPKSAPIFVDGTMAGTGPRIVLPAEAKSYEVFTVVGGEKRKREIEWPKTRTVDLTSGE